MKKHSLSNPFSSSTRFHRSVPALPSQILFLLRFHRSVPAVPALPFKSFSFFHSLSQIRSSTPFQIIFLLRFHRSVPALPFNSFSFLFSTPSPALPHELQILFLLFTPAATRFVSAFPTLQQLRLRLSPQLRLHLLSVQI
ncbi:hypothetical protein AB3S75_007799 [Citrus x aurantiifolia]